jgi:hypothetical protein
MELAIITETQQLKNFISETAQLTDVYRGIQRNYVWVRIVEKVTINH